MCEGSRRGGWEARGGGGRLKFGGEGGEGGGDGRGLGLGLEGSMEFQ